MVGDISLIGGHESRCSAGTYHSKGKDLLSGLCHAPHLDAVLCLWTYSVSSIRVKNMRNAIYSQDTVPLHFGWPDSVKTDS